MARAGTLPADIADYLGGRSDPATIEEIAAALRQVRRSPVLRHSVRSAIYQHADGHGSNLFVRTGRGRYRLQK